MKRIKYSVVFVGFLIWLVAGFFSEAGWVDPILAVSSIMFLILLFLDFIRNKLKFSIPKIHILVIDLLALGTILSGSIVTVDYANYFLYLFVFCTVVFIFTSQHRLNKTERP